MRGFSARIRRVELLPNGYVRVDFRSGLTSLANRDGSLHSGYKLTQYECGEIRDRFADSDSRR